MWDGLTLKERDGELLDSILITNKIKKIISRLMENEDLRLLLLQRLNQSTQDEGNLIYVEDLVIFISIKFSCVDRSCLLDS